MIDGIVDVLGLRGSAGPPLFDTFTGISIGAVNSTYLAANAQRADHAVDGLVRFWTELDIEETLRCAPLALWGWPRWRLPGRFNPDHRSPYVGRSLFDPRPVEALFERVIAWDRLHANIGEGLVRALVVATLDVLEGRTTLFTELAPGVPFHAQPHRHPTHAVAAPITTELLSASTALPMVFPARSIGGRYYMDGGLRFSTPIVPALTAEAERVVVISLLYHPPKPEPQTPLGFPGFMFLLGQVCSALLLDPIHHNLDNLLETNRLFELLDETLDPPALDAITEQLESDQIMPSGRVPILEFRPSRDITALTSQFLREELSSTGLGPLSRAFWRRVGRSETSHQALLASILFLDGRLAAHLIDLGRRDAHAAEPQILAFFGQG